MSYVYRLKCRIDNEGIANTVRYIGKLACYCLTNLITEIVLDLKYSRKLLRGNHKTRHKNLGANDVYHTAYSVLPHIFGRMTINPDDVLVDVGCGKGRVINYWLSRGYKNKMVGLELDPEIAKSTAKQFSRWNNVRIINGDAIDNLPDDGTVFYFYNPFACEKVRQFEKRVGDMPAGRAIRIIYYNPKSIHEFYNNRWDIAMINFERDLGIKRWGRMNKYHDLAVITRR